MDSSFFQEIHFLVSDLFLTIERLFCYVSFFPNMGNSWPVFKTFFEYMDAEVILPDPMNRNDVKIGAKHSPEYVCFPFKTTLGD